MKHAKNCRHPKGQTDIVVPTDAVVAWAKEHPCGATGSSIFKGGDYPFP